MMLPTNVQRNKCTKTPNYGENVKILVNFHLKVGTKFGQELS